MTLTEHCNGYQFRFLDQPAVSNHTLYIPQALIQVGADQDKEIPDSSPLSWGWRMFAIHDSNWSFGPCDSFFFLSPHFPGFKIWSKTCRFYLLHIWRLGKFRSMGIASDCVLFNTHAFHETNLNQMAKLWHWVLKKKKTIPFVDRNKFGFFFEKLVSQTSFTHNSSGFISTFNLQTTRGFCITSHFVVKSLYSSNLHMKLILTTIACLYRDQGHNMQSRSPLQITQKQSFDFTPQQRKLDARWDVGALKIFTFKPQIVKTWNKPKIVTWGLYPFYFFVLSCTFIMKTV